MPACRKSQRRTEHSCAEEGHGQKAAFLRAMFFHKPPQEPCGHAQKQNGQRKRPGRLRQGKAHLRHNGTGQNTPGIDAADGNMDSHCSQSNQPTIPHENHPFCCINSNRKEIFPSGQNKNRLDKNLCPDGRLILTIQCMWSFPLIRQPCMACLLFLSVYPFLTELSICQMNTTTSKGRRFFSNPS